MFPRIMACAVAFARGEDGRTAVEYAIVVNVIVLLAITGISVSGFGGKQTINKVCDRVGSAYQSAQATIHSFMRPHRAAAGASNALRP